jgi:hypothetical protein
LSSELEQDYEEHDDQDQGEQATADVHVDSSFVSVHRYNARAPELVVAQPSRLATLACSSNEAWLPDGSHEPRTELVAPKSA